MEWVIKDIANDTYLRLETSGELIIYGDRDEAEADLYGNEVVMMYEVDHDYDKLATGERL